jgi:hypothetical protein
MRVSGNRTSDRGIRPSFGLKLRRRLRRLRRDRSGIAVMELAICLPPLIYMGMYGLELVNLATANMQISQIALSLADNASRLGQTDNSGVTPTIQETDVDSVMTGAVKQGAPMDLVNRGKIILTSLEVDGYTGKQYIHWQRCRGALDRDSAYGNDTNHNGLTGAAIAGLGDGTQKITALPGSAVMFVEIYYNYERLFGDFFIKDNKVLTREAAFVIRDDRNLTPGVTGTRSSDDTCAP